MRFKHHHSKYKFQNRVNSVGKKEYRFFLLLFLVGFCSFFSVAQNTNNSQNIKYPTGYVFSPGDVKGISGDKNFSLKKGSEDLPASIDWSESKYFPPIGRQELGSCVPWSTTYYTLTFYRAREKDIDLSGAKWENNQPSEGYQDKILSPYFGFNLTNGGQDEGTTLTDNVRYLSMFGAVPWSDFKDHQHDVTYLPGEAEFWKKAAVNRTINSASINSNGDFDFFNLKALLAEGTLFSVPINIFIVKGNLVLTTDSLPAFELDGEFLGWTNHVVTMVGYDDSIQYNEGDTIQHGAFKCVNSHGPGWGPNGDGTFYISYKAIQEKFKRFWYFEKQENYIPEIFTVVNFNHSSRKEINIGFDFVNQLGNNELREFTPGQIYIHKDSIPFEGEIAFDHTEWKDIILENPGYFNYTIRGFDGSETNIFNSLKINFEADNIDKSFRYSQAINQSLLNEGLKIHPLVLDDESIGQTINKGDKYSINYKNLWDLPVSLSLTLDSIDWENISTGVKSGDEIYFDSDYNSPKTFLKLYYSQNPAVNDVSREINYHSGNDIKIVQDLEKEKITVGVDNPKISWENKTGLPVNVILRNANAVFDTLLSATEVSSFDLETYGFPKDSSVFYFQISSIDDKSFVYSKKFQFVFPQELFLENAHSEYFIGETVQANLNLQQHNLPVNIDFVSEKGKTRLFETVSENKIEWVIPEDVIYNNRGYFIVSDTMDNPLLISSKTFTTIPFKKNYIRNFKEDYNLTGNINGTPAITDSHIFLSGQKIFALFQSGDLDWSKSMLAITNSSIVLNNNSLWYSNNQIQSDIPKLFNLSFSGNEIWNSVVSDDYFRIERSNIALNSLNSAVVYSAINKNVVCVTETGQILWSYHIETTANTTTNFNTTPAIDYFDNVYIISSNRLIKLNNQGQLIYDKTIDGCDKFGSLIIGVDQNVYLSSNCGIFKIDTEGQIIWKNNAVQSIEQPVIDKSGNLIIADNNAKAIVCINDKGDKIWSYSTAPWSPISSPVLGSESTINIIASDYSFLTLSPEGQLLSKFSLRRDGESGSYYRNYTGACTINKFGEIIIPNEESNELWSVSSYLESGLGKSSWPKPFYNEGNSNRQGNVLKIEAEFETFKYNPSQEIRINCIKSSGINQASVFCKKAGDSENSWKIIQEVNADSASFVWKAIDWFSEGDSIEFKIVDTENSGLIDFAEKPVVLKTCEPIEITETVGICEGENYFGFDEEGIYIRELLNLVGCDSIVTTHLSILSPDRIEEEVVICSGENYNGWDESGQYVRYLSNSNGCDSVVITRLTVIPEIIVDENIYLCQGEDYNGWYSAGIYERILQNQWGCDSIVVTNLMEYEYNIPIVSSNKNVLESENIYESYQWFDEYGAIQGATNNTYEAIRSGSYYLEVTDFNGCVNQAQLVNLLVQINEESDEFEITTFPNPNNGIFKIRIENIVNQYIQVRLLDSRGQLQFNRDVYSNSLIFEQEINVSHLPKGVYFIEIVAKNILTNQKVIIN